MSLQRLDDYAAIVPVNRDVELTVPGVFLRAHLPGGLQQGDLSTPSHLSRQCRRSHESWRHSAQAPDRCAHSIVAAQELQTILNGPFAKNM